jgi:hypothetical protein
MCRPRCRAGGARCRSPGAAAAPTRAARRRMPDVYPHRTDRTRGSPGPRVGRPLIRRRPSERVNEPWWKPDPQGGAPRGSTRVHPPRSPPGSSRRRPRPGLRGRTRDSRAASLVYATGRARGDRPAGLVDAARSAARGGAPGRPQRASPPWSPPPSGRRPARAWGAPTASERPAPAPSRRPAYRFRPAPRSPNALTFESSVVAGRRAGRRRRRGRDPSPLRANAAATTCRSRSRSSARVGMRSRPGSRTGGARGTGRARARAQARPRPGPPRDRITARSRTCWSSRTFPASRRRADGPRACA